MISNHPDLKRLGLFVLRDDVVLDDPEVARAILKDCIVLRCEQRFDQRGFEYIAAHPDFAETTEGFMVTRYEPVVDVSYTASTDPDAEDESERTITVRWQPKEYQGQCRS